MSFNVYIKVNKHRVWDWVLPIFADISFESIPVSPLFGGFMRKMTLLSNSVLLTDAYKPVIYEQNFHKPSPLKHNATMNNRNDI